MQSIPSFFHFFTNLKFLNEEDIKKISLKTEKELASHLDTEFELGLQFIEEIIPNATEFYLGIANNPDEYSEYIHEQIED
jgi:hypothetical protein